MDYDTPAVVDFGDLVELTAGSTDGDFTDAAFPGGHAEAGPDLVELRPRAARMCWLRMQADPDFLLGARTCFLSRKPKSTSSRAS